MKKARTAFSGRNGFSMVEILVALVIFAAGILGMIKLSGFVTSSGAFNAKMANAINVAHDDVEFVLSLSQTSTSLGIGNTLIRPERDINGVSYASTVNITGVPNSTNSRRATVTVTWQEKLRPYNIQMVVLK